LIFQSTLNDVVIDAIKIV